MPLSLISRAQNALIDAVIPRLSPRFRRRAVNLSSNWFEEVAYMRLADKDFRPSAIIDVGAFEGDWTRMVRKHFPETQSLMVEAQAAKRPILDKVCAEVPRTRCVEALLGSETGREVTFYEMSTGSSMLPELSDAPRSQVTLKTRALDDVLADAGIASGPLVLKIDVQGAELEVLRGATRTLAMTEVIQLELAVAPYNEGAPTLVEVLGHVDACGFVPFEVCGFSRPSNRDLAQIDMMFVPRESALRPRFFNYV